MELTSQPSAAPTPARKRVALLIGASAALVLSQFFLAIFLSQRKFVPVAWFVPAALAFYFGAALSIALLSLSIVKVSPGSLNSVRRSPIRPTASS